jgi:phosphoserine phosphatase
MSSARSNNSKAAVFFDLDGTLIPEPSLEQRLFSSLRGCKAIPFINYLFWSVEALRLLPIGLLAVQHANKRYLTGLNTDLALEHINSLNFFEQGIERVAWHAQQFHPIVLVTGTLHPLAELAAAALECELEMRGLTVPVQIVATKLEESHGYWTGGLKTEALYGAAKARAVLALAHARQWSPSHSHAYGNSVLDNELLCTVGHAHPVNPGRKLAAIANQKHWPICHWYQEKRLATRANSNCISEIPFFEGQA